MLYIYIYIHIYTNIHGVSFLLGGFWYFWHRFLMLLALLEPSQTTMVERVHENN